MYRQRLDYRDGKRGCLETCGADEAGHKLKGNENLRILHSRAGKSCLLGYFKISTQEFLSGS